MSMATVAPCVRTFGVVWPCVSRVAVDDEWGWMRIAHGSGVAVGAVRSAPKVPLMSDL